MNLLDFFRLEKGGDVKIRYVVKGTSDGYNITYKCGGGDCKPVQEGSVPKGWKHTFTVHPGDYFFLAAQANRPNASVDVRVYKNGKIMQHLSKTGNYPLVAASGTVN